MFFGAIAKARATDGYTPGLEAPVAQAVTPVDATFDAAHLPLAGLEVIPTPGHTVGSTCFLVQGAAGNYLFTGDSLFPDGNGWSTYVSTDHRTVDASQWQRILDTAIADLR
jgi:glyoxylase-like metal-dependent hydrolase (beta-lactamase superfamily II)